MKMVCLFVVFTALLGGSAAAAPPLLDRWDGGVMTGALKALNATGIREASFAGEPGLLAATPDGLNIGLYAKACIPTADPGQAVCRGVEGIVSYDPGNVLDRALLVDELNHAYAAGKFMVERDGAIRLTRYLNLDGGVA